MKTILVHGHKEGSGRVLFNVDNISTVLEGDNGNALIETISDPSCGLVTKESFEEVLALIDGVDQCQAAAVAATE